ncbi:hypothetical protein QJS10_CPB18g01805 [Acorus calamus]|uniref:PHD-type domain-containing protein n=1 Tax=Acorus calamus TaxID=4465 RepID=A0AAV9CKT4_ACOCL|nr:hypothetical protein QJS10_CPB18g01805 [Acorus calamus]
MISSKVVLTYKRRRLLAQSNLAHGSVEAIPSSRYPGGIISSGPRLKAEFGKNQLSERGDDVLLEKCVICNADGDLHGCGSCHQAYHIRCLDQPLQHSEGEWQCPLCSKLGDTGKLVQEEEVREPETTEKYNNIEIPEARPIRLHSHKVLLTEDIGETFSKERNDSIGAGMSIENKLDNINLNHSPPRRGSTCKLQFLEMQSDLNLVDIDPTKKSSSDSPVEINCVRECTETHISKLQPVGNNDPSQKVKCDSLHSGVLPKERFGSKLITFSRRAKRKSDLDEKFIHTRESDARHKYEESSNKCRLSNASSAVPMLQNDPKYIPFQLQRHTIADSVENNGLEASPAGGLSGITIDEHPSVQQDNMLDLSLQGSSLHSAQLSNLGQILPLPSGLPAECGQKNPTIRMQSSDMGRKSLSSTDMQEDNESNPQKIASPVDNESNPQKVTSPHGNSCVNTDTNIPECWTKEPLTHLELSVAPPGSMGLTNSISTRISSLCVSFLPATNLSQCEARQFNMLDTRISEQSGSCKLCIGVASETVLDPKYSADQHSTLRSPIEESHAGSRCLGWLGTLDGTLHETSSYHSKCRNEYLSTKQDSVSYSKASQDIASFPMSRSLAMWDTCQQTVSWDHVPQIATPSADFHRRMNASYQASNSSSLSLGLSPMKPDELVHPIKNICMGFPELRHKLDNIMTYGEKQYHSTYHASSWSEGELDSLWIGVRRHGLGNWQTMLKDRKLCFPEWRVAGDLARQWEEEKIKLLDGSQVQPAASLANASFRNQWVNIGSNISSSLGIQTSAPETRLSLGNIYFQRDRNILERYPFQLSECDSPVLDCYKDKSYTRRKPRMVGPDIGNLVQAKQVLHIWISTKESIYGDISLQGRNLLEVQKIVNQYILIIGLMEHQVAVICLGGSRKH